MQPSMFNLQVPLPESNEVFLMNTFSDAQLLISTDVAALLDRIKNGQDTFNAEEREAVEALVENGFIVDNRDVTADNFSLLHFSSPSEYGGCKRLKRPSTRRCHHCRHI